MFWFNIQRAKKSYRWQFSIFTESVSFSFSTFLESGWPNHMSPKSAYQPQISSRSALDSPNLWLISNHISSNTDVIRVKPSVNMTPCCIKQFWNLGAKPRQLQLHNIIIISRSGKWVMEQNLKNGWGGGRGVRDRWGTFIK